MHQNSKAFEFNDDLLLFIAEHISSGWFGDFMFNSEKDRKYFYTKYSYVSIWMAVFSNQDRYTNNNYSLTQGILLPSVRGMSVVLWRSMFSKWHERVAKSAWLNDFSLGNRINGDVVNNLGNGTENDFDYGEERSTSSCGRCKIRFVASVKKYKCKKCNYYYCEKCSSKSSWLTSRTCVDCSGSVDNSTRDSEFQLTEDSIHLPSKSKVKAYSTVTEGAISTVRNLSALGTASKKG
jgi:hypothetical protein